MNGCDNTGLRRFEENLIRFATNKQGVKLNLPGGISSSQPTTPDYSKNQNLNQLIKDLIFENSKSWVTGYVSNSVTNIRVTSKDHLGRPLEITANYQFEGLFGRQTDQVSVTFVDGIPECLYFKAYSFACRTPDRGIVGDLIRGQYITM